MSLTSTPAASFHTSHTDSVEATDAATITACPIAPEQIELVRSTWTYVAPMAEEAATLFYGRLFQLDPAIKPMFAQSNLQVEKRKLMQTIGVAIKHLHRLDAILPVVRDLGRRQACYGVQERHFDTVAEALLWAFEQGLGDRFTADVRDAWAITSAVLVDTMKDAAADALDGWAAGAWKAVATG